VAAHQARRGGTAKASFIAARRWLALQLPLACRKTALKWLAAGPAKSGWQTKAAAFHDGRK